VVKATDMRSPGIKDMKSQGIRDSSANVEQGMGEQGEGNSSGTASNIWNSVERYPRFDRLPWVQGMNNQECDWRS